jgi:hypothetical protein
MTSGALGATGDIGGPVLPRYGKAALSDLMSSAAAVLGVPGFTNVLGLPEARSVCVLLVDGLGWNLLRRSIAKAPFLASLTPGAQPITAGFPSTTATSVTSLGTGLPSGEHGVLGYKVAIPHAAKLMNSLTWDPEVDPLRWQPHPTVFERLAIHGTPAFQVSPGSFQQTGLTRAGMRGARYVPAETAGDVVAGVARSARHGGGSLVYAYYADLDKTGHLRGCRSAAWEYQLAVTDRFVEQIAGALPEGGVLVVTGDHGMVDVPAAGRLDVEADPRLTAGIRLIGGEPRMRYLYTEPGAEADVLAAWQELAPAHAWVVPRQQAIDEGWFGPTVLAGMVPRIGDVIAAARGDATLVLPAAEPRETELIGHHGSLTEDEQLVPLLIAGGDEAVSGIALQAEAG